LVRRLILRGGARRARPDDLARHICVEYRREADGNVLMWLFERNRKSRRISVDGRVMVNDADLASRGGCSGCSLDGGRGASRLAAGAAAASGGAKLLSLERAYSLPRC